MPPSIERTALRLAAVIAFALLLRLLFLNKSFWLDEGVAFADAWSAALPITEWREWFRQLWQAEFNMAFYFALLRLWIQAGTSEAFLRLLSVIPAVATVPVVFALGKRLFSERIGLIAALLLAVHGAHVGYSQELRGYTLVVFLSAASTLFFVLGIEEWRNRYWILYAIVSALAVYSHFFGGLVVAAQWASLCWAPRRAVPWRKLAISTVAIALSIIPPVLFVLTNKGQQVDWIPKPGLGQLANVISEFAGSPSALPVYIALWWLALRYCIRPRSADGANLQNWHTALVITWAILPTLLALLLSLKRPMLVPRYLLVSAPASVLLAALGAAQISIKRSKVLISAAVLLSLAFVAVRYARPKEDWRGASAYVLSQARKGDAVAVVPWWSEAPFAYYNFRSGNHSITEVPGSTVAKETSVAELARQHSRLWLIVYARPQGLSDPQTTASQATLGSNFELVQERDFRLVRVRLYTRKQ
jgi:uncharacterized membrane protein